nr:hypothetical protein [Ardenticatena sp.]
MKRSLHEQAPIENSDGHRVVELIGLASTNTSRYSVAHITAPAGTRGQPRTNRFDELLIVKAGHGSIEMAFTRYDVAPDDVVLIPAGTRYAIHTAEESDLVVWAVCIPAYRPEWSQVGEPKMNWRNYQVPRGVNRLRPSDEE